MHTWYKIYGYFQFHIFTYNLSSVVHTATLKWTYRRDMTKKMLKSCRYTLSQCVSQCFEINCQTNVEIGVKLQTNKQNKQTNQQSHAVDIVTHIYKYLINTTNGQQCQSLLSLHVYNRHMTRLVYNLSICTRSNTSKITRSKSSTKELTYLVN